MIREILPKRISFYESLRSLQQHRYALYQTHKANLEQNKPGVSRIKTEGLL